MLTWPEDIRPALFDWYLNSNSVAFTSPFNGSGQTASYPGSSWEATMTLDRLNDWESRMVEVLIVKLDGMSGRVLLQDFGRWGRPPMGAPKVKGTTNSGLILVTDGWTPNRKVLSFGDYITVNSELKMVTEDLWSDAEGNGVIGIAPLLRTVPPHGSVIETQNPTGVFRLEGNKNGVKRSPAFNNAITLKFVEAF